MLSSQYAQEKRSNRNYLMQIVSTIRFLARQGQLLLLLLHAKDNNSEMQSFLDKRNKFTSPEIQNELIYIMAQQILRSVVKKIQSKYFTIMIDEATDVSNSEQVVIVLRWVGENLSVHEDFIGLYKTDSTNAATLVSLIKDLMRCGLSITMCRGQCYDGASVMTGVKGGVSTLITKEEKRAVFTHCGHSLNLAMNDTVKRSKLMKSALDVVTEISKLIKKSHKRDAMF